MGRPLHSLLLVPLLLLAMAGSAAALDLQCSTTNGGKVVLNELFSGGGGQGNLEFVELYFLQQTNISGWKLYYHDSNTDTGVALGSGSNRATAYLPGGAQYSDNNCPSPLCTTPTTFPAGTFIVYRIANISPESGELLLTDTVQSLRPNAPVVVDYLKYYKTSPTDQWDVPSSCGLSLANHNSASKDIGRLPNGTGSWSDTGSTPTQGATNTTATSNVDHYELWHDGQGLTCQPETITIKVCQNPDCSTLYNGMVTVTMLPSTGWINGATRTFTGGSLDMQFRQSTPGVVTIGIASADPVASYLCRENGVAGDCTITFADSGFVFSIPTQIANKTSNAITLSAASRSGSPRRCQDLFTSVIKNITFLLSYINPNTGTQPVYINGTQVNAGVPTTIPLTFNASGDATFTVKYSDAGQIRLDLAYNDGTTILDGNDTFVVRPAGLCVESPDPNADCASLNGSCTKFKKAGESFNLRVKGMQWVNDTETNSQFCDNAVTPNFRLNAIPLSLTLVAPTGGNLGSLGQSSIDLLAADAGSKTISNQTISEVGVFTITAAPPEYLVPGVIIPPSTSAAIGRFYPDQFTTAVTNGTLANLCNGFTYTGQPFSYGTRPQITVAAWNKLLGQVQNYRSDFRKLTIASFSLGYPTNDTLQNGADNATKLALASVPDQASAVITDTPAPLVVTLGNDSFTYTRTPPTDTDQARVGPFTATIAITVNNLTDSDGVTTATGDLPKIIVPAGNTIRYGEGVIQNTFGPENIALTMPLFAFYYNGTTWATNTLDNCTQFAYAKVENGTISVSVTPASPLTLANGTASIILTPVSDPSPPGGTVTINGNVPVWLEPDPAGEAIFGLWRGNNRIINWKEIQR